MDNFRYAPGMNGYGSAGIDGSSGLLGLAVYFTSYDGDGTDVTTLKNKIDNNLILAPAVEHIPGYPTRIYQDGDIFIDINGKAYEIVLSSPNRFQYANYNLSGTELFINSDIPGADLVRYSNVYPNKIIDTVNTLSSGVDYWLIPNTIYGIESKKYARIEYSDTDPESIGRNPFTLFIGASATSQDNYALALVRDIANNTFRLGNLDDLDALRNVNLIFDVSSLRVNKNNNEFSSSEPDGTVLTNHEIDSNNLMTPVFNYKPTSFKYLSPASSYVSIYWDKKDFFPSADQTTLNNITANLYFTEKISSYNNQQFLYTRMDASTRKMTFPSIDSSGVLDVSGLVNKINYESYITFFDKGWMRNSAILNIGSGINLIITNPAAVCYPNTIDISTAAITVGSTPGLSLTYWYDLAMTPPQVTNPKSVTAGTYYIKGTQGSIYSILPVVATVNSLPIPTLICSILNYTFCSGTSVTFTAGGGISYEFFVNGVSQGVASPTPTFTTSSLINGQIITVQVTNLNGCSALSSGITVTVVASPTILTTTPGSRCGAGIVALSATASSGTINWWAAPSGGLLSLGTGTSFTTPSLNVTTPYYVDSASLFGCVSTPRTAVYAYIYTIPTILSVDPSSRCGTGTVTLKATTSDGTIYWYAASSGGSALGNGNSFITPSISSTTTYYIEARTSNDCISSPRTAITATVNPLPTPTIIGTNQPCQNTIINYLTQPDYSNYIWTVVPDTANISIISGGGTSDTSINIKCLSVGSGQIKVNYTNAYGCSALAAYELNLGSLSKPAVTATVDNATPIQGNTIFLTGGPAGMSVYHWVTPAGDYWTKNVELTNVTPATHNGTYTFTATNNLGCSDSASFNVTVIPRYIKLHRPNSIAFGCNQGPNNLCDYYYGHTFTVYTAGTDTWSATFTEGSGIFYTTPSTPISGQISGVSFQIWTGSDNSNPWPLTGTIRISLDVDPTKYVDVELTQNAYPYSCSGS